MEPGECRGRLSGRPAGNVVKASRTGVLHCLANSGGFHVTNASPWLRKTAMIDDKNFDRKTLEKALTELGLRAFATGRTVEIVIYGGSALLLTLNRQVNTGDV